MKLLPLLFLVACAESPLPVSSDAETSAPEALAPDEARAEDSAVDDVNTGDGGEEVGPGDGGEEVGAGDVADTQAADLGPPPDPAERPLAIAWAIQSDASPLSSLLHPATLGLGDGSVVMLAPFDGTITFGDKRVSGSDDPYVHGLFARVTPGGEVAALSWLCDRCVGMPALAEMRDGHIAFASLVHGEVVLAPGSAEETRLTADHQLMLAVLDGDGRFVRSAMVARLPFDGSVRALTATPDGGLVVAGDSLGLEVQDGPSFSAEEGWHYPGRAFVLGVDAALRPRFAEQLGGQAGSTIGLVHQDGDALVTVGDFGGYPLGVSSIFGAGSERETTLASVSSDDDPALDIFVARWSVPGGAGVARPALEWVRRVANYSNGPRTPTWIRGGGDAIELRIDGSNRLEPDDEGHWTTPWDARWSSMVVRASAAGELAARFASASPLIPSGAGFVSLSSSWGGSELAPGGSEGPSFSVPEATNGVDGVDWNGHVLASWRADGALLAAGMMLQRVAASGYPLYVSAVVPEADGSLLVVMHGSPSATFIPSAGEPVTLARESNYERLVVMRVHLVE